MPTVLITGCFSGFGLETAKLFLDKGWKVVATMRQPKADTLPASPNLVVLPLDVTDPGSIARRSGRPARSMCWSTMRGSALPCRSS